MKAQPVRSQMFVDLCPRYYCMLLCMHLSLALEQHGPFVRHHSEFHVLEAGRPLVGLPSLNPLRRHCSKS